MPTKEYMREYRITHPLYVEANRKYMRDWSEVNRESKREYVREHYKKNQEYYISKAQQWKKENPDKTKEQLRKYQKNNLYKWSEINHRRRARLKDNGGSFTVDELNALFKRQEGCCFYCGDLLYSSFDKAIHIDHKIPISRGGKNDIENIALSCAACNMSKHTKTHKEFLALRTENLE